MISVYETPPLREVGLNAIGRAMVPSVARIARGHEPHGQLRYLWTDHLPPAFPVIDGARTACPAIELIALPNVELRSDWMPYADGQVVTDDRIFPAYTRQYYETGNIDRFRFRSPSRRRAITAPTFLITHFNMRTYGHFLLEVLPKFLLIRELYGLGLRFRVAFPASLWPFMTILRTACPEITYLVYDDYREALTFKLAILPTAQLSSSAHLHELAVSTFKLLSMRLGSGDLRERRIFLSRLNIRSFRTLSNERELQDIASAFGFEIVHPETLKWSDQVKLFRSASHVVGEFSSALHNTLFSSPSTKVIGLNWWAPVQSAIAASVGHEVGYVMPRDGAVTRFIDGWTETQNFEIDPDLFRHRLEQIGLRADGA